MKIRKIVPLVCAIISLLVFSHQSTAQAKAVKLTLTSQTNADIPILPYGDIVKETQKSCRNVTVVKDEHNADFSLEALSGEKTGIKWLKKYKFTLFNHDGSVVYFTESNEIHRAMKDVCAFINKK